MAPFAYWDSEDRAQIAAFSAEWTNAFPSFRIYDERNVLPLMEQRFPEYVKIYRAIRLRTAKCNVARLILLYEFGGIYIDCHVGIRDLHALHKLLASLRDVDAVFIDRILALKARPLGTHFRLITVLCSRPRLDLMLMIAKQGLVNLARHREFNIKSAIALITSIRSAGRLYSTAWACHRICRMFVGSTNCASQLCKKKKSQSRAIATGLTMDPVGIGQNGKQRNFYLIRIDRDWRQLIDHIIHPNCHLRATRGYL